MDQCDTTTNAANSIVKLLLQVADGPDAGDFIEAGLDDIRLCPVEALSGQ